MSAVSPLHTNVNNQPGGRDGRRRNNLNHGLRAVTLGSLPRGANYVGRLIQQLRQQLEADVVAKYGSISLTQACHINTACRWEKHAMLAQRWLKASFDTLSPDQRVNFSREVAKASESRDRAIRALELDVDSGTILDSLYAAPITSEPTEGSECATGI